MKRRTHRSLICFFVRLSMFFPRFVQSETDVSESLIDPDTQQVSSISESETTLESITKSENSEEIESISEAESTTGTSASDPENRAASESELQTYEGTWAIVSTLSELQTALRNKEAYIKLADSTDVFVIGNTTVTITANVVIDGNNRQISYFGDQAFHSSTAGLTITLQNMTFGSPDFTVRAEGLYGIMRSAAKSELHINNVNFFSDKIAQPFYFRHKESKIYFHGTNLFMQQKADGSVGGGEEFAEGNNFEFAADSYTKIVQNTSGAGALFWMPENPASITVGENAVVDITSNHAFSYSDGTRNCTITLGKNSKFLVKGTNPDNGNFFYYDKPATITVGEGAELSVSYPRTIKIAAVSEIKFLPNSIGNFEVTHDQAVFDRSVGPGSTFEIDNAKRLHFKAKAGTAYNPIGFASLSNTFSFSPFGADTNGYEVITDEASSPSKLTPQLDPGIWTIVNDITRTVEPNTPDFTSEEKKLLQNAESITLKRLNPPVELLEIDKEIDVNEATFRLSEYQLHGNDDFVRDVEFKLYTQKTTDPAAEGEGFVEGQATNLSDSVSFSNLKEQTNYWLYVRINCDPDSQSSEWLEVSFETAQKMIDVDFPVEVAFYTENKDDQQMIHPAGDYSINNNSSFVVKLQATDLEELSNPAGIHLLSAADEENQKDLLLNLTEADRTLGVLTKNLQDTPLSFNDLAGNSSTRLGFSGIYYGDEKTAQKVQYRLTLTAERKE